MKAVIVFFVCVSMTAVAQVPDTLPFLYKDRQQLERTLVKNVIEKNLSLPLADSTESRWNSAFFALQYLQKHTPWIEHRIRYAITEMHKCSPEFQRGLLELIYGMYPQTFHREVEALLEQTDHSKVFAMAAHYLLLQPRAGMRETLMERVTARMLSLQGNPWMEQLLFHLRDEPVLIPDASSFLQRDYLPGQVLVISIQRKNRDYPGLAIVRNRAGEFIKDSTGKLFTVPQIARSLSGLPGYLTNGNTPEGLLRMDGYGISKAGAIGPTTNLQLTLPMEYDARHFYRDSIQVDSIGNIDLYRKLLPEAWRDYFPVYEAYYAGKAGRHEIIAHGTTVKPSYYRSKPFYPFTPTLGCLCTNESWDDATGQRLESDQLKLVHAVEKAGGPDGYLIVINLDDQHLPVQPEEILSLLKRAGQE
ncbi:MAG TPA: hypothetical protein PLE75_00100 [Ferruginibacter sp.]|nr:hypothetical protein [Ferruginibacter sp.]HRO05056.1 hypothetical protein [Ferruginibacter sp.]HRO95639.1 hypothetical protein [Ferruginibacter sp.]HRP49502.1 hypothetical protein [Ferruginibacter sp.]